MTTLQPIVIRVLQQLHAGATVTEVAQQTGHSVTAIRTLVAKQPGWLISPEGKAYNPGGPLRLPEGVTPAPAARPPAGVDILLAQAADLDDRKVQAALQKTMKALAELRSAVNSAGELGKALAELEDARRKAAAAAEKVKRLGGKVPAQNAGGSASGPSDREIRAYFAERGVEAPKTGRLTSEWRARYAAEREAA